ncbi:PDR/VanB family oxidoreductase [Yoonia sp. MH D7]
MSVTISVTVEDVTKENEEVVRIVLANTTGADLPDYDCGAHIDIHLPNGLIRQYSLWPAPGAFKAYHIAVKREPASRGGSAAVHDLLNVGDTLSISVPRNNFALKPDGERAILLAAGIGITPILSMASHLDAIGKDYELHYFTRSREVTAFADLIESSSLMNNTTHYFGLDGQAVQSTLSLILDQYEKGTHVYLCGPTPFIDAVAAIAKPNWPDGAVHLEHFSADAPVLDEGGDSFEVHLAKSNLTYDIPSDKTIADVLMQNGIEIELSCEQGICGTCLTKVLEGTPEHEDMYLSDEEHAQNDQMTICVSRCKGRRIVLDL